MTEQELKKLFDDFKKIVADAKLTGKKKINFFSATKMLSLETKHSALLAWLFDPANEHELKNAVLKKLLWRLYGYNAPFKNAPSNARSNKDILGDDRRGVEIKVTDARQTAALANATNINVYSENETHNKKRIDILVDIVDSKTVIVIENKIDSSVHDNQLQEYQDYIAQNQRYSAYQKKIFIYLTKTGEYPKNSDGSYNGEWCRLDYRQIVDIIQEIIDELNKNVYPLVKSELKKLLVILGDYKEMVDTSILNKSVVARQECEDLLANPTVQAALDIIEAYKKLPTFDKVFDYTCARLGGLREGTSSKTYFYTPKIKEYFVNSGEEYKLAKLRIVCKQEDAVKGKQQDRKIIIYLNSESEKGNFSKAQAAMLEKWQAGSSSMTSPSPISPVTLVERNERGKEFDDIKADLDKRIDDFKRQLDDFYAKYL